MSKRNFILLIIILVIVVIAVFGFLYFRQSPTAPGEESPGINFISRFNPFGTSKPTIPVVIPPVDISGYEPGPRETQNMKLMRVSGMPVAGYSVYQKERLKEIPFLTPNPTPEQEPPLLKTTPLVKPTAPPTEFVTALRYVDRATGNIYQTFVDKIEERKFSGTTIPKVYEAYFGNNGEFVIMRYLKTDSKTIQTFVGTLPKEYLGADTTPNNEVKGYFLPDNIKDMSVSSDAKKIFYLFNLNENTIGTTLNLLDDKKVQVFDSPFTEWLSSWPNDKMITLSTKPSANIPGYIYAINLLTKDLSKILGNINGLTTLMSPDGKLILYGDNNLSLYIHHVDSRNSDVLTVKTMPEISDVVYCAVPKLIDAGEYPDTWYQGEVSFRDQFWKIDIKNGNAIMILDPVTVVGGEEIDGIKLSLDESEGYLFFVNKKDSFLWKLSL